MKKIFVLLLLVILMFTNPVKASADPYPDWDWNGIEWIYVGSGEPGDPPPPHNR